MSILPRCLVLCAREPGLQIGRAVIPLLASLALPLFVHGQVVRGRVLDAARREALAGAQVNVQGVTAAAVTDSAGWFLIRPAASGNFTLRVALLGYARLEQQLTIAADEELIIEVALAPNAIPLNPITVIGRTRGLGSLAGFNERAALLRRIGLGDVITRADIERRSAARAADLFGAIAGSRIRGDTVRFRRSGTVCRPQVFINGIPYTPGLLDIPIETIAGIEVYRSISQQPVAYRDPSGCGVILVWTDRGSSSGSPLKWKHVLVGLGIIASGLLILKLW